jgi:hypothetical protein
VGLGGIAGDDEGSAGAQLGMGADDFAYFTTNHERLFGTVELIGFTKVELEWDECGFTRAETTIQVPLLDVLGDTAIMTFEALRFEEPAGGAAGGLGALTVGFEGCVKPSRIRMTVSTSPLLYFNLSLSDSRSHFLIVLRDKLVRRAISLISNLSRNRIRRIFAYINMAITFLYSCLLNKQGTWITRSILNAISYPWMVGS